ncbi:porin [Oricola sp.]|uniref:porin n=1 Tax=Oricola sp. TaxID=1979950 RepID=UPI003BAC356C
MKIKSLLLGSAAAMLAVSGASAADKVSQVVIPEPEVVEYVRVCDAYGTGYFYIPGTETCLRVHGYVRFDVGFGELQGNEVDGGTTYDVRSRGNVRVSTARETDLGTLRTTARFHVQNDDGESFVGFDKAYLDLGGLRIGSTDSLFTTFTGYAGAVINDGAYGPFNTNLISYTYSGGAFSLAASVEQTSADELYDYLPHIVIGAGYDAGVVNIRGVAGYDATNEAWAGKVRVDADVTDAVSAFIMAMYGQASSGFATWTEGGNWSVIGGASFDVSDDTSVNAQVQWFQNRGYGSDPWTIVANVNHNLTDGMIVRPEVLWARDSSGEWAWGGKVRFQVNY